MVGICAIGGESFHAVRKFPQSLTSVENRDVVALFAQQPDEVQSDESASAQYQRFHESCLRGNYQLSETV
jgi:hypothetical protein